MNQAAAGFRGWRKHAGDALNSGRGLARRDLHGFDVIAHRAASSWKVRLWKGAGWRAMCGTAAHVRELMGDQLAAFQRRRRKPQREGDVVCKV
jgi:hypothetical protein